MATHGTSVATGMHYLFDEAGDGIAMHAHPHPETRHSTHCLKGSCGVYINGVESIVNAGEVLTFDSYLMHEIVALQAGTEIVNELDAGAPEGWLIGEKVTTQRSPHVI